MVKSQKIQNLKTSILFDTKQSFCYNSRGLGGERLCFTGFGFILQTEVDLITVPTYLHLKKEKEFLNN